MKLLLDLKSSLKLRRLRASFLAREDGVVAVEFALLAPLFLLLLIGVMVMSLYFATSIAIAHAATEGARASVRGVSTTSRAALADARVDYILEAYKPLLTPARATVTTAAGATISTFQVTVSYPVSDFNFQWFYNLLDFALGSSGSTAPSTISRTVTIGNGGYG